MTNPLRLSKWRIDAYVWRQCTFFEPVPSSTRSRASSRTFSVSSQVIGFIVNVPTVSGFDGQNTCNIGYPVVEGFSLVVLFDRKQAEHVTYESVSCFIFTIATVDNPLV